MPPSLLLVFLALCSGPTRCVEPDLARDVSSTPPRVAILVHDCLDDPACLRRLSRSLQAENANTSLRVSEFLEVPRCSELEEPDSLLDVGSAAERSSTIFLAAYAAVRAMQAGANEDGEALFGHWDAPVLLHVAVLAFANGLVLAPPAQRANYSFHMVFADTCKFGDFKCNSPYALNITSPLLIGRPHQDERFSIPRARAALGGSKFTTSVALVAGWLGVPNIGFYSPSDAATLSNTQEYPTYLRMSPTRSASQTAIIALLLHLNYTSASLYGCDLPAATAEDEVFGDLLAESGVSTLIHKFREYPYTVWPAGSEHDGVDEEASASKKAEWDSIVRSAKAFNAHLHIETLSSNCPQYDIIHYLAMNGLAGGGHVWTGYGLNLRAYIDMFVFVITTVSENAVNKTSPYAFCNPFDGYLGASSDIGRDSQEYRDFWELMQYVGDHQEAILPSWLQGRRESDLFTESAWSWMFGYWPFLFDAVFATLYAINDLLLETGASFTNEQLLQRMRNSSFLGVSGDVAFDEYGNRQIKVLIAQTNFFPENESLHIDMPYTIRKVAQYAGELVLLEPFSFYNSSPTPPPDKDLDCAAGSMYVRQSGRCVDCPAGKFTRTTGLASCEDCYPGSYNNMDRSSTCTPCAEGFYAANASSTECMACEAGRYNDAVQQSTCRECSPGSYSVANASKCQLCPRGRYASGRGNVACASCAAPLTSRFIGSTSDEVCICAKGTYMSASRGTCVACPGGMSCALGSDEAAIARVMAKLCQPMAEDCIIPQALPKFMTLASAPLRIFECLSAGACPGGPPGSCGPLRDSSKVACAVCEDGAYFDGEACVACSGGVDVLHLLLVAAIAIIGIIVVVFVVNRDMLLQSNSMLLVAIICGLLLTSIQTMGVFSNLSMEWFEPLKTIFKVLMLLSFDLGRLKFACFLKTNVETMFLLRQLTAPAIALAIFAVIFFKKRLVKPNLVFVTEYTNSIGTVFSALFISMTTSVVLPFICYGHPDGGESMLNAPSVLCWEAPEHFVTVALSAGSFVLFLCPFIALVAYGTLKYNVYVAASTSGLSQGLLAFRFLYFRFRPSAHFYGAILMARSMMICLVPVVIRSDPAFQICVMSCLMLLGNCIQMQLQPWRGRMANVLDGLLTSGMVLFLICGTAGADFSANQESVRLLGSLVFACFVACIVFGLGAGLYSRLRPKLRFQWFICHHKRDAAAQARMMKIAFQVRGQTCFIDSDDLIDLDKLFDIVKTSVEHLVVYLTRETLTRPWCAGEITTATCKGLKMTCVETHGFVPPQESELQDLAAYLDLSSMSLSQYSISFEHVAFSYKKLLGPAVQKITLPTEVLGCSKFYRIATQLLKKEVSEAKKPDFKPGALVVSSDPYDDEATAAAGILISKTQGVVFSFMQEGIFMLENQEALGSGNVDIRAMVWDARGVVVILSASSLECRSQLQVILAGMARLDDSEGKEFQHVRTDMSRPTQRDFEVIPVNTPNFQFPSPTFFDTRLFEVMQGRNADCLAVKAFFKRLSICFSTHASDMVLQSQADQVVARIPRSFRHVTSSKSVAGANVAEVGNEPATCDDDDDDDAASWRSDDIATI